MTKSLFPAVSRAVLFPLALAPALIHASEPLVIVVTPSGIEQPEEEANSPVTIIDRETIELARSTPPAGTRARLRGEMIHKIGQFGVERRHRGLRTSRLRRPPLQRRRDSPRQPGQPRRRILRSSRQRRHSCYTGHPLKSRDR